MGPLAGLPVEVLLAAGYAAFLLAVAAALEGVARHSRARAGRLETAGFRYHEAHDRWECPQGEHLVRVGEDRARHVVRYRAHAHVCNACPLKGDCTDSDDGREIARSVTPWLESEIGRFHRGLSLALVLLAALVLAVGVARHPDGTEGMGLAGFLGLVAITGVRLAAGLRS